jgi:hypothetical protein
MVLIFWNSDMNATPSSKVNPDERLPWNSIVVMNIKENIREDVIIKQHSLNHQSSSPSPP